MKIEVSVPQGKTEVVEAINRHHAIASFEAMHGANKSGFDYRVQQMKPNTPATIAAIELPAEEVESLPEPVQPPAEPPPPDETNEPEATATNP